MSWSIQIGKSGFSKTYASGSIITMGIDPESDIVIPKCRKTIHSQIIIDEEYMFHIYGTSVHIYYLDGSIIINDQTLTCQFTQTPHELSKTFNENDIYQCFQSETFKNIVFQIQNSYFDIHSHKREKNELTQKDILQYGCYLYQCNFNNINVFLKKERHTFKQMMWCLWARVFKYGILTPAILNTNISEIMVNGSQSIYFEIAGKLEKTAIKFSDNDELRGLIDRMCAAIGRKVDESTPYCDARLMEGHRIHVIIPPLSLIGPCLTIRKFPTISFTINSLVRNKSVSPECIEILQKAVLSQQNILISGGTGTGKTTLLNCLSGYIPTNARIITIEDSAELKLQQPHVIQLESRPENFEKQGKISIRDLVKNSLRMRPDRVIVGECRSAETLDMLQAMNTGHSGSMTTVHANSPKDALARLETLTLFSETHLPSYSIRQQIASAIDIIVQLTRFPCGRRVVTSIEEIIGFENTTYEIFTKSLYQYAA